MATPVNVVFDTFAHIVLWRRQGSSLRDTQASASSFEEMKAAVESHPLGGPLQKVILLFGSHLNQKEVIEMTNSMGSVIGEEDDEKWCIGNERHIRSFIKHFLMEVFKEHEDEDYKQKHMFLSISGDKKLLECAMADFEEDGFTNVLFFATVPCGSNPGAAVTKLMNHVQLKSEIQKDQIESIVMAKACLDVPELKDAISSWRDTPSKRIPAKAMTLDAAAAGFMLFMPNVHKMTKYFDKWGKYPCPFQLKIWDQVMPPPDPGSGFPGAIKDQVLNVQFTFDVPAEHQGGPVEYSIANSRDGEVVQKGTVDVGKDATKFVAQLTSCLSHCSIDWLGNDSPTYIWKLGDRWIPLLNYDGEGFL